MANIVVLLIMAGCAAYQFFKGNFIRAFATFMAALCANIVAFAWFEQLADLLIRRDMLPNWAQTVCFAILFIISFAILQTLVMTLARRPVDLGTNAERAGRIALGLMLGLILSGSLLTATAMAPLPGNYPYQRFELNRPDPQNPHKLLLNPDGFITRWFSIISSGSLSGSKSFAVLHAGFLDNLFLNRLTKDVSARAESRAIELPNKAAAWQVTEELKDISGNPLASKTGYDLIMVRIGFTSRILTTGGSFTPGQLRLLCKQKGGKKPFQGTARSIYPMGYLKSPGRVQQKGLADQIKLQSQDLQGKTKWIDFAFYVPAGFEPVALALKANEIVAVPQLATAEEAPKPIPFIQTANCATDFAKLTPLPSAKIYGLELASGQKLLEGAMLIVSGPNEWTKRQTQQSIKPAQFERNQIVCVQAELKKVSFKPGQAARRPSENDLPDIFKVRGGYRLLSLKCNNPIVGSAIPGEQLPTLIDSKGTTHRPCGLIAAGKVDGSTTFEADFCSTNLSFTDDGAIAKPFPESFWLTEKAQNISQLYVLYMVKTGTIIISVQPARTQAGAVFEAAEGFLVN